MSLPVSRYAQFKIMFARILGSKLFLIVIFLAGIAVGLVIHNLRVFKEQQAVYYNLRRLYSDNSNLVNPLISVENPQGGDDKLESIKYSLQGYIDSCKAKGSASHISVYLRDLNKGTWIGINEGRDYAAASLIKVPVMLVYLKMAEDDPAVLNKQIKYETELKGTPQNIMPQNSVQLGNTYTVDQLLRYMICYSDNVATYLLFQNMPPQLLANLYSSLQLPVPDLKESEYKVCAKVFATFFRVLYSTTFLSQDLSKKAMELLVETDFRDGIIAGVPGNIIVAHKFAERKYTQDAVSLEVQLHDCGIVYCPKGPYLVCIMTEGRDFNALKAIIKGISSLVYERQENALDIF